MCLDLLGKHPQASDRNDPVQGMLATENGPVYIEGPVEAGRLKQLDFSDSLTNFRPAQQQKKALVTLAGDPDGSVYIARFERAIIGYATFHDPDFPWWKNTGIAELVELGGLEVAAPWRSFGVAKALFKALFCNEDFPYFEDKIVMNIQTIYCWDLNCSTQTTWQYRNMMKTMLEKYNFAVQFTDDPEVREHPANMLMVRIGKKVSRQSREAFEALCLSRNR